MSKIEAIKAVKDVTSFLMVGQSNMAGRGDIGEVEPIKNGLCHVLRFGVWQPMCEPLNVDRGSCAEFLPGVCLATSFADALAKHTGEHIGLIPCAYGGSGIKKWQPGGVLFDHAVMMAKLAMRTSTLGGIIWHQGENDCSHFDAEAYRAAFLNTMTSLRRELGEDLPIIIGELSGHIAPARWEKIARGVPAMNALLRELASELPNCRIVKAADLPCRSDGIHFSAASCRTLGVRYFEEYKALTEGK
ncbi:MAG: sialate O-acetylesterase [Clostridia bacterium]|nr:sialate O-acetylesterase [Clostridia bacterium]